MNLFILRHGLAEEHSASIRGGDSQRRLTAEGKKKIHRIAAGMKALKLDFDVVISSPYLRARETADIVVAVLGIAERMRISPHLASEGNPKLLLEELNRHHHQRKSMLLVGHEPYLSRLISTLISGNTHVPITLKKGGLCKLFTGDLRYGRCAALEWLLAPAQSKRIK